MNVQSAFFASRPWKVTTFFYFFNKKGINLAKKKEKRKEKNKTTINDEMLPCFIGLLELKNRPKYCFCP